jgi:hypothetical protein
VNEYREAGAHLHRVAQVELRASDSLLVGEYIYLLARATIRAAREQDLLLPIVVNLRTREVLNEDATELCLSRVVSEGRDARSPSVGDGDLREIYSVAETALAQRFQGRRDGVERLNQAFVDARLASIRESYRSKIQRKKALLERAQVNRQEASYIRMLEGGIRNLTVEQDSREAQINQLRSVTAEHSTTAAGFLNVV